MESKKKMTDTEKALALANRMCCEASPKYREEERKKKEKANKNKQPKK